MKKMMKRFLFSITAAAAALCLAIPAFAATATSTLTVSMSLGVPATATVSVAPMAFPTSGSYVNATQSTAITVNASNGLPYTISLNKGLSGTSANRYLKKASGVASNFPYYLYKDAARTIQWGDSDFAATFTSGSSVAGTGTGANQTLTVYGSHYTYSMGTYTDDLTVTVNY